MNKEQLKRGNELQKDIEDFLEKVKAAESALKFPENVSIKIHFNAYGPYELDTILKEEAITIFKQHYEELLEKAKAEFDSL